MLRIDKIRNFGDEFMKQVNVMMKSYSEGRIIFDRYINGSLKEKTQAEKTGTTQPVKFIIQDAMSFQNVPMKLLSSHVDTKSKLTEYLGERFLEHFATSEQGLRVR